MTTESPVDEQPLFKRPTLAKRGPRRPLKSRVDWVLFVATLTVAVVPLIVGVYYSFLSVGLTVEGLVQWWGLPMGIVVFILSLTPPLLASYALMEVRRRLAFGALGLALAAWPGVALAGVLLSK